MPKEPQSYGSQGDWVTGNVGETVNRQKDAPSPEHDDFYDSRRSSETTAPDRGGHISDEQLAENNQPRSGRAKEAEQPAGKVTDQPTGARRGGFFKDRDYS